MPSSAARAVGGGPAHAIGLVLRREPELLELDPFFPAFLTGVQAALAPLGQNQLMEMKRRPTAIFYSNDLMAIAGLSALADRKIRVPDDVAVAGFDDISLASYVTPSLTSIYCDYRRMGQTATEMLLANIQDEPVPQPPLVGAALRLRRSTGD